MKTRLVTIIAMGLVGWVRSYFLHINCNANASHAIRVPPIIAYLFGSFREDHIIHFAGAVTQLFVYIIIPSTALFIAQKISFNQFRISFGTTFIIVIVSILVYRITKWKAN